MPLMLEAHKCLISLPRVSVNAASKSSINTKKLQQSHNQVIVKVSRFELPGL